VPRTADPTALSPTEARELRGLVDTIRAATGLTNEQIAEKLDWGVRSVTHAMSSDPLLAKNAYALLHAVKPDGASRHALTTWGNFVWKLRTNGGWLARYDASQLVPSVFIPKSEIDALAKFVAAAIAKAPSTRTRLERRLEKVLQKAAPRMAQSWYASQTGLALLLEFNRECEEKRLVSARDKSKLNSSAEWKSRTDLVARVIRSLVEFSFKKPKEAK
jgi:hypothetical protein